MKYWLALVAMFYMNQKDWEIYTSPNVYEVRAECQDKLKEMLSWHMQQVESGQIAYWVGCVPIRTRKEEGYGGPRPDLTYNRS